jgi:PRC-barrel domain
MAGETVRRSVERRQAQRRTVNALDFLGAEVIGYRIQAADGYIGRAEDFCVEEESSVVTGLLVTTGSGRVFVPLNAIERIDKRERKIYVTPTRDEVRQGSRRSTR